MHPKLDLATFELESAPGSPYSPMPLWGDGEYSIPVGHRIHVFGFGWRNLQNTTPAERAFRGVVEFLNFEEQVNFQGGVIFRSLLKFSSGTAQQGVRPGDSGGPAMGWTEGVWKQVGVTSGSIDGTVEASTETLIADVRPSRDWILAGATSGGGGGSSRPPTAPRSNPVPSVPGGNSPPPPAGASFMRTCIQSGYDALNLRNSSLSSVIGALGDGVKIQVWKDFAHDGSGTKYQRVKGPDLDNPGKQIEGFIATSGICP